MRRVSLMTLVSLAFVLLAVAAAALSAPSTRSFESVDAAGSLNFVVDANKPTIQWKHYWKECVGSGHALLALREDYRAHLEMARRDLGVKFVRFHGIYDDDLSTLLSVDASGKQTYSFFNLDSIYDFLLSIGMKPYVELSFMPEALASNSTYVFHYKGNTSPPKDYEKWTDLVTAHIRHTIERYGIDEVRSWYFEVWNEPNLDFWTGTQADYFKLYSYTARAIKQIDSRLRVGGPATAQSQWIPAFKSFVLANNLPLDFISTHEYPTDVEPLQRDIMKKVFTKAREEASPFPVIYSEYNSGLFYPGKHDDPYASAFVMYNVQEVQDIVEFMSYWTFSDIFEEGGFDSLPFHQGFGLMTIHQVPKPAYRAFEILHRTGRERMVVSGPNHPTVGTFAILNQEKKEVVIIAYNHNIPNNPIKTETVTITVSGLPLSANGYGTLERIDDTHCNAAAAWKAVGSPAYLDRELVHLLRRESELQQEKISYTRNSTAITFDSFYLPAQGVAAITLRF